MHGLSEHFWQHGTAERYLPRGSKEKHTWLRWQSRDVRGTKLGCKREERYLRSPAGLASRASRALVSHPVL